MRGRRHIKIEKAQEKDCNGVYLKHHFHITTLHTYSSFVFYFYSSYYTYDVGLLCGSGV